MQGGTPADSAPVAEALKEPTWIEYCKSFFPVILAVLLLRSFLVEPFRIPSGSMMPTLLVGDFILVNKYTYGLRLPVLNTKVVELGQPQRGDVVVFRYPVDPGVNFIKRVIGLPGETVEIRNKQVYIDGERLDEDEQVCRKDERDAMVCEDADASDEGPYKVFFLRPPRLPGDPEFGLHAGATGDNYGPQVVPEGELLVQEDLGNTLRKLVEAEAEALAGGATREAAIMAAYDRFYRGDIAREIVDRVIDPLVAAAQSAGRLAADDEGTRV